MTRTLAALAIVASLAGSASAASIPSEQANDIVAAKSNSSKSKSIIQCRLFGGRMICF